MRRAIHRIADRLLRIRRGSLALIASAAVVLLCLTL